MKNDSKPYYVGTLSNGQPAVYSVRGLVAVMEAGYGATRQQDAKLIVDALNERAKARTILKALIEHCEAGGMAGGPGDMPDPALDDAREFLQENA